MIDFEIENHGSIVLLRPVTPAAREWVDEHILVDGNEVQTWAGAIVVEPRYVADIVHGFQEDGLCV